MAEKKSRRIYAGYYNRYDGKLIYVVKVVKNIDTGEKLVICQYANHSDTEEDYIITRQSFCERIAWNGQMVDKYLRRTRQMIDESRITTQHRNALPGPKRNKPKPTLNKYDNRGYRRPKTYYAYTEDLCAHYWLDCRKHQLCRSKNNYICIIKKEFDAMTEDLIFSAAMPQNRTAGL